MRARRWLPCSKPAAKQGISRLYARRLLAAMSDAEHDSPVTQALIDPLSERELDVLRLLGTELNGPAIARELMVSLNTVRTHTKSIYAKLAVSSRRAAVRRAQELDLLPRNPAAATPAGVAGAYGADSSHAAANSARSRGRRSGAG